MNLPAAFHCSTRLSNSTKQELKDEGRRFGEAIFDREVSTFAPTDDAPVPANYVLGPGDELT